MVWNERQISLHVTLLPTRGRKCRALELLPLPGTFTRVVCTARKCTFMEVIQEMNVWPICMLTISKRIIGLKSIVQLVMLQVAVVH